MIKKYFAAIAMLISSTVNASPFVEIGGSHYKKPANGIWWQDQYRHAFDLDGKYFRIGYGDKWRVSYFSLGKYSTEALATPEEIKYFNGECNVETCRSPDLYKTNGSLQGILFSHVLRGKLAYVETGISYSRQTFDLIAVGVFPNSQYDSYASKDYRFNDTEHGLGYMVGLGLEYKNATLSINYFKNDKSSEFQGTGGFPGIDSVKTLAVGYRF